MERPYANHAGDSGVVAYELRDDGIVVRFRESGDRYLYTDELPGRVEVATMMRLAAEGRGLCTYISRHVKGRYAAKLG